MLKIASHANRLLALMLVGIFATTSTTLAEKPPGKSNDKHHQSAANDPREAAHSGSRHRDDGSHFSGQQRDIIHQYYADQYRSGKCPPGLAKKNNGCMPPGQAKKWRVGHALPRDVIYHDLPRGVAVQLGPAPAGHRFVRVASDILMIAVGTGMVVDAIEDLGNL